MSLEQALIKRQQEVTTIFERVQTSLTQVKAKFIERSTLVKNKLVYKSLLTYAPLDYKKDTTLAPIFESLLAHEASLKKIKLAELASLDVSEASLTKLNEAITALDTLSDAIYQLRDEANAAFETITPNIEKLEKSQDDYRDKLTKIIHDCDLSSFEKDFFADERFKNYPGLFKTFKTRITTLKKEHNKKLAAFIKAGLQPHQTIDAMLSSVNELYNDHILALETLGAEIKQLIAPLMRAYYNVHQLENVYQALAEQLLAQTSVPQCEEEPYRDQAIIKRFLEMTGSLRDNVDECVQIHQENLAAIKINDNWIEQVTSETLQATIFLENIQAIIKREYDLAKTELFRLQDIIETNRDEIKRLYEQYTAIIVDKLQVVSAYLTTLRESGIDTARYDEPFKILEAQSDAFLKAQENIAELSDKALFYDKQTILDTIERGKQGIVEVLDELLHDSEEQMRTEKTEFNDMVDAVKRKLEDFDYFVDDSGAKVHCFLEPGAYCFAEQAVHISPRQALACFDLPATLCDEISKHRFDAIDESGFAPPLAARKETIRKDLQAVGLDNIDLTHFLMQESVQRRRDSDVVAIVNTLIESTQNLKLTLKMQNITGVESDITRALEILDTVIAELEQHNEAYTDLRIPNKKAFLKGAVTIIEQSMLRGPIEHLSDGIRAHAIQWIRIHLLRPLLNVCNKYFGRHFNSYFTFFATDNEREFIRCGLEAKDKILSSHSTAAASPALVSG